MLARLGRRLSADLAPYVSCSQPLAALELVREADLAEPVVVGGLQSDLDDRISSIIVQHLAIRRGVPSRMSACSVENFAH